MSWGFFHALPGMDLLQAYRLVTLALFNGHRKVEIEGLALIGSAIDAILCETNIIDYATDETVCVTHKIICATDTIVCAINIIGNATDETVCVTHKTSCATDTIVCAINIIGHATGKIVYATDQTEDVADTVDYFLNKVDCVYYNQALNLSY